ncbi:MAG TPA: TerB family tellurite resistance protein [Sandaracinaceae bacterium LLY-WYZ-13_1]|nr:TerB family tellurite resistance protein [Sandaracinaceae bacterium LLY-WYZ-13_1]
MYRDTVRSIDDLHAHEQLALGGLLRVLIRLDGRFTPAEEAQLARVGEELGGADDLRAVVARSAEVLADDAAIRDVARQVERPEARLLIREALEAVARADTIHPAEQSLLDWCDELWGPRAAP